jgi:hypothetical protein
LIGVGIFILVIVAWLEVLVYPLADSIPMIVLSTFCIATFIAFFDHQITGQKDNGAINAINAVEANKSGLPPNTATKPDNAREVVYSDPAFYTSASRVFTERREKWRAIITLGVLLVIGILVSILHTLLLDFITPGMNDWDPPDLGNVGFHASLVLLYCAFIPLVIYGFKKKAIKLLLVLRLVLSVFVVASTIHLIAYTIYPLPNLRSTFIFLEAGVFRLIYPGSVIQIYPDYSYTIWVNGGDFTWFFSVTCALVSVWCYFVGFVFLYPRWSPWTKLKKFIQLMAFTVIHYVIVVVIESAIYIETEPELRDWDLVHGGVVQCIILSTIRYVGYIIVFYKLVPDIRVLATRYARRLTSILSTPRRQSWFKFLRNHRRPIERALTASLVVGIVLGGSYLIYSMYTRYGPELEDPYVWFHRVGSTSMQISWTPATDDFTPRARLEYRVFGSNVDNIDTIRTMNDYGVPLCDWIAGMECFTVGNTPYYYFNVMVRNEHGNQAAYTKFNIGLSEDVGEMLQWINANITDRNEFATVDLEMENGTELGLIGLAMIQTNETYSAEALQRLGARYVLIQFGYLISGLCGDEFKSTPLIQACNNHTAELVAMGLERDNWYGESDQVTTVFDEAEYFNATGAPEPKWFDSQLARLSFNGVPSETYMATTQLEYWYAREINGDHWSYDPRLAADGSSWGSHIPPRGNYTLTHFAEAFRSSNGLLKIYEIV